MSEHTKEPWQFSKPYKTYSTNKQFKLSSLGDGNETVIATGYLRNDDNGRRIVACVNACAGIDTEILESTVDLHEAYNELQLEVASLTQTRSKLLDALISAKSTLEYATTTYLDATFDNAFDEIEKLISEIEQSLPNTSTNKPD